MRHSAPQPSQNSTIIEASPAYADNVVPLRRTVTRTADADDRTARLQLLGAFELHCGGRRIPVGAAAQRLLALLALRQHPLARATAAGVLWPDVTDQRAQANLRTALYRLNQVCAGRVVEATSHTIRLSPTVSVDATEVAEFATALLDDPTRLPARWPTIESMHRDLLPEWDHAWLRPEQQRYRSLRLHCLEALCDRLLQHGRFGQAADAVLAVVHADPFRESAHGKLIRVYLAEGNRNEAVQHYLHYRRTLRDELGLNPSPEIGQLVNAA